MKKSDRIRELVRTLDTGGPEGMDEHYLGFFPCFNAGQYYEAHDVLEDLWLRGCGDEYAFYKGLIQIAGAYVHLRKQFLRPEHPKDGKRLRPAVRLFALGVGNLARYGPHHLGLDVSALSALCQSTAAGIVASDFTRNPWRPELAPQLHLS